MLQKMLLLINELCEHKTSYYIYNSNVFLTPLHIFAKKIDFQKVFGFFENGQKKMSKIQNQNHFLEKSCEK